MEERNINSYNFAEIIGFDRDTYEVYEEAGVVRITVAMLGGSLSTNVVVRLNTSDRSATCEFWYLQPLIFHS